MDEKLNEPLDECHTDEHPVEQTSRQAITLSELKQSNEQPAEPLDDAKQPNELACEQSIQPTTQSSTFAELKQAIYNEIITKLDPPQRYDYKTNVDLLIKYVEASRFNSDKVSIIRDFMDVTVINEIPHDSIKPIIDDLANKLVLNACVHDHYHLISLLLIVGNVTNQLNHLLIAAIVYNRINILELILTGCSSNHKITNRKISNALTQACARGNLQAVQLITEKYKLDLTKHLFIAIYYKQLDVVKYLASLFDPTVLLTLERERRNIIDYMIRYECYIILKWFVKNHTISTPKLKTVYKKCPKLRAVVSVMLQQRDKCAVM